MPNLKNALIRGQLSLHYSLYDVQATLVTPWRSMLTSGPVWAIIIAHFTENWGFYTLLTGLPSFMRQEIRTLGNTETLLSED
jgi:ACS family sodium-dependent inorganic phosphate cotransporter